MGPFFLVLLTLNPHTGDLTSTSVVGAAYQSIAECMRAAIERGPQKTTGDSANLLVCRTAGNDYAWDAPVRHDRRSHEARPIA